MVMIKDAFQIFSQVFTNPVLPSTLNVSVGVNDAVVRDKVSDFDGMEKVFALVPSFKNSVLEWTKQPLQYARSIDGIDTHTVALQDVDAAAIAQHGVAIGFDSAADTVWAQSRGDNYKPEVISTPDPLPSERTKGRSATTSALPVPRPRPLDARLASVGERVAAFSSRIVADLDDSSLLSFAKAQADVRGALSAPDATSEAGLVRIASAIASMKDDIEAKLWSPQPATLRASLERLLDQLDVGLKLVRSNL